MLEQHDEGTLGVAGTARVIGRNPEKKRFEAAVSRDAAQNRLIDDLLNLFGGRPVMARLVQSGQVTIADIKEAEDLLKSLSRKDKKL